MKEDLRKKILDQMAKKTAERELIKEKYNGIKIGELFQEYQTNEINGYLDCLGWIMNEINKTEYHERHFTIHHNGFAKSETGGNEKTG